MSQGQLEISHEAAQKVRTAFDDAQEDLEANASTMPSSGSYGGGEIHITFALSTFADASGTFGQAASYGSTTIHDGVDLISGVDEQAAANIRTVAEAMPDE